MKLKKLPLMLTTCIVIGGFSASAFSAGLTFNFKNNASTGRFMAACSSACAKLYAAYANPSQYTGAFTVPYTWKALFKVGWDNQGYTYCTFTIPAGGSTNSSTSIGVKSMSNICNTIQSAINTAVPR